jgi:hypothetical protein
MSAISSVPYQPQLAQPIHASPLQTLEQSKVDEHVLQDAPLGSVAASADPVAAIKELILQQSDPLLIMFLEDLASETVKLNTLLSFPQQVIHGERFYLTGNCSYEEAEIRGFADRHNLAATLDPVRWSFLNQASSAQDVIYFESFYIDEKISQVPNACENSELVLSSKNCHGFEPKETLESDKDFSAFQNSYKDLKQLEERFSKLHKSQTVTFLLHENFEHAWRLIRTPELENLLDRTISSRSFTLRTLYEEDLHRQVTDELSNIILWLAKEMEKNTNETFEIRQQSLFQACESDVGELKYVVVGMHHFPTPLNENNPQLESTRKYFASKKLCVLISEQIIADQKSRVEEMKQEISEKFPSTNGKI